MFATMGYRFVIASFTAALLAACSTTQVQSTWKDPHYQVMPQKIMVVGVTKRPANRRLFEDEFVQQLQARGVEAIASYTVVPDSKQDNQRAIAREVKRAGADALLITRTIGHETVKTAVPGTIYAAPFPYVAGTPYLPPPFYNTWQDYYSYGYEMMYSPGYVAEDEYATIETNLYQADSQKLVWAATSETSLGGAKQQLIKQYIAQMVKAMTRNGVLAGE